MSWLGAIRTATGGMLRHKVQAVVIGMVLLVSTASATLGLTLLAASNTPFTHAFGTQRGADVTVTVNAARASSAELAATRTPRRGHRGRRAVLRPTVQTQFSGQPFGQLTLAGRASPGGPVDDVVLNAGHWPDGPGPGGAGRQPAARAGGGGPRGRQHSHASPAGRASRTLTVVGFGNSITNTADGWVTPGEITRLRSRAGRRARRCCTGSPTRPATRRSARTWPRSPGRCRRAR